MNSAEVPVVSVAMPVEPMNNASRSTGKQVGVKVRPAATVKVLLSSRPADSHSGELGAMRGRDGRNDPYPSREVPAVIAVDGRGANNGTAAALLDAPQPVKP